MNVGRICSHGIVSVRRGASLGEAAALMKAHHVGALLVLEEDPQADRPAGIVTDRDLVLYALAEGIGPTDACVEDVMTPALATVPASAGLFEAAEAMRTSGVRRLAVSDERGDLVGIVSMDDIVDAIAAELGSLALALRAERAREERRGYEAAQMTG
ncbi:MAG: CBS domain-containing protein [Burkholderiales bacterium]|nr:CBS domain-containing protein [Burkholderiales bacterium]